MDTKQKQTKQTNTNANFHYTVRVAPKDYTAFIAATLLFFGWGYLLDRSQIFE